MRTTIKKIVPYILLFAILVATFRIGFLCGYFDVQAGVSGNQIATPVEQVELITKPTVSETIVSVGEWGEFIATAYCPCEKCCGVWASKRPLDENGKPIVYGAGGEVLRQGVSVAADTSIYPMGTLLEIEGMGTYCVQDRGGAIKENRIDIYFDNHREAVKFGKQTIRVREVK